jgi:hypothetical protein
MALRISTVLALALVEERACPHPLKDAQGRIPVAPELTTLLVALTEEVARLERRVKELEERP